MNVLSSVQPYTPWFSLARLSRCAEMGTPVLSQARWSSSNASEVLSPGFHGLNIRSCS
jgi:hypothetical protein